MRTPYRVAIVYDGHAWFVRHIRLIEHDLKKDEKVYRCDWPLGGPFSNPEEAAKYVQAAIDYEGWGR